MQKLDGPESPHKQISCECVGSINNLDPSTKNEIENLFFLVPRKGRGQTIRLESPIKDLGIHDLHH